MLRLSDFDYELPQELIAQYPARRRGRSRLLVLDRRQKGIGHHIFCDIINFLRRGDLLVLNNTKVIPARLMGRRRTGGKVEVLLLKRLGSGHSDNPTPRGYSTGADIARRGQPAVGERYHALVKPLARLKDSEEIFFDSGFSCRLADAKRKIVEFERGDAREAMRRVGSLPLPPYIRRASGASDRLRYQTVFAEKEGAVASPTAGLHFTKGLLSRIKNRGVDIATLTLHVNYGTFSPVRSEDIRGHRMEEEDFQIPRQTVESIRQAKREGRRVLAVGTTVCRALEHSWRRLLSRRVCRQGISSSSNLFIYPPFDFKITDALITNFHLPRTTLLMLVSAFAGRDMIMKAYKAATQNRYRFYSYGDAMLIV